MITTESDSKEAFINPKMGGLAFRLPHGSLLLKVARHELHATTALNVPNRYNPSRIGMVFYQHANLHFADHGASKEMLQRNEGNHSKYVRWLTGNFVPIRSEVNTLTKVKYSYQANLIKTDAKLSY